MSYYNPFQNLELRIPESYRDEVSMYCQTQQDSLARVNPDHSPFPRYVDLWFLAVCLGARRGKLEKLENPHRFITGEILARDSDRIDILELLAIAHTQDPWVIGDPARVIDLANEFAAAGLGEVISMLRDGNSEEIWNLTDHVLELLTQPSDV